MQTDNLDPPIDAKNGFRIHNERPHVFSKITTQKKAIAELIIVSGDFITGETDVYRKYVICTLNN